MRDTSTIGRARSAGVGRLIVRLVPVLVIGTLVFVGYRIYRQLHQEKLDQAMLAAIGAGNEEEALARLKQGADPYAVVRPGREIHSLRDLLAVARGERNGPQGPSALALAIHHGQMELSAQLLSRCRMDVHERVAGRSLLAEAVVQQRTDLAELLLKQGANEVDEELGNDQSNVPLLTYSAMAADVSTVRLLLDHGAHLPKKSSDAEQIVSAAAGHGWADISDRMTRMGAPALGIGSVEPLATGPSGPYKMSELTRAADSGDLKKVQELMARGALPYEETPTTSLTDQPVYAAAVRNRGEVLRYMLDHGKKLGKENLSVLLDSAAERSGNWDTVRLLAERGGDVNYFPGDTPTPLIGAAECGDVLTIRELLDHGADPNLRPPAGEGRDKYSPPIFWAVENGNLAAARLLIERGARISDAGEVNHPCTPLMLAAEKGSAAIVKLLLSSGADPNKIVRTGKPPSKRTALSLARENHHKEVEQMLLRAGATE